MERDRSAREPLHRRRRRGAAAVSADGFGRDEGAIGPVTADRLKGRPVTVKSGRFCEVSARPQRIDFVDVALEVGGRQNHDRNALQSLRCRERHEASSSRGGLPGGAARTPPRRRAAPNSLEGGRDPCARTGGVRKRQRQRPRRKTKRFNREMSLGNYFFGGIGRNPDGTVRAARPTVAGIEMGRRVL